MYQVQRLEELLARNEDWIISKLLVAAKNYHQNQRLSLINHSWRETINGYSSIITESYKSNPDHKTKTDLTKSNKLYDQYVSEEVNRCFKRKIQPHVYLAFLKDIRSIYEELVFEANLSTKAKTSFYASVDKCFDCIEVAFIKTWQKFLETKPARVNENEFETQQTLFDALPIPLFMVDPLHKVVKHNYEAVKLLPAIFKNYNNAIDSSYRLNNHETLNSKIDEFRISHHKQSCFETFLSNSKGKLYVLICLKKLHESENTLVSIIDLTQWKSLSENLKNEKDKANKSNHLKTLFLANMSHEIRTPMNAIVGFAELLSMTKPNQAEKEEYLCLIKKSSTDLLNIIEDVIDIAKIESNQLKIHYRPTKPAELINDLAKLYSELLIKQGNSEVSIKVKIPENEQNIALRTDPKRLKQVLSNLIGNASKFTEKGSIEIGYKMAENKLLYFYVKDTGVGIPYQMQSRIFDQFTQVDKMHVKNKNGTGLGLTISKNIINLLGGNLWVSSVPGKGSNFYFYLPYIKTALTPKLTDKNQPANNIPEKVNLNGKTVLIAEDEDSGYLLLKASLKNSGINLLRARTGNEAIQIVESNKQIDAILMDIRMPEISGIDAARYIHHIRPEIPIIAQTAFAMENDKDECLNAGCSDYIKKPIQALKLISLIKKHTATKSHEYIK